jgi:hypothetical protein
VVSYHPARRSRSALAYGSRSTTTAETTSTGSYTTNGDATCASDATAAWASALECILRARPPGYVQLRLNSADARQGCGDFR